MVLNPHLYKALTKNVGRVVVTNPGVSRVEKRTPLGVTVVSRGEHYNVDCPVCGDTRGRLSIGYQWLEVNPVTKRRRMHVAHCFNEGCTELFEEEFWGPIAEDIELSKMGLLDVPEPADNVSARTQSREIRMPVGCVPVHELGPDHFARRFLASKYNLDVDYLGREYGVSWTEAHDEQYPRAQNRIVFPIHSGGKVVAWQARATDSQQHPRWYLPPGFVKCVYNGDRVPPTETPILCEGIPAAIACGMNGVAIFGKEANRAFCQDMGKRWSSVMIATDPETFVPDNRPGARGTIWAHKLRDTLSEYVSSVRLIKWPKPLLKLGQQVNDGQDVKCLDAADLGMERMAKIIARS